MCVCVVSVSVFTHTNVGSIIHASTTKDANIYAMKAHQ